MLQHSATRKLDRSKIIPDQPQTGLAHSISNIAVVFRSYLTGVSEEPEPEVKEDTKEQVVRLISTFCEEYPVYRVEPNIEELENLWQSCSCRDVDDVASAIYEQFTWASGEAEWQPRLRALRVLDHFSSKGAAGSSIIEVVLDEAGEMIRYLADHVPKCREAAAKMLHLRAQLAAKAVDADVGTVVCSERSPICRRTADDWAEEPLLNDDVEDEEWPSAPAMLPSSDKTYKAVKVVEVAVPFVGNGCASPAQDVHVASAATPVESEYFPASEAFPVDASDAAHVEAPSPACQPLAANESTMVFDATNAFTSSTTAATDASPTFVDPASTAPVSPGSSGVYADTTEQDSHDLTGADSLVVPDDCAIPEIPSTAGVSVSLVEARAQGYIGQAGNVARPPSTWRATFASNAEEPVLAEELAKLAEASKLQPVAELSYVSSHKPQEPSGVVAHQGERSSANEVGDGTVGVTSPGRRQLPQPPARPYLWLSITEQVHIEKMEDKFASLGQLHHEPIGHAQARLKPSL